MSSEQMHIEAVGNEVHITIPGAGVIILTPESAYELAVILLTHGEQAKESREADIEQAR